MKHILYITTRFPSLTSTFIYREIETLQNAGFNISTISIGKPSEDQISQEAIKYFNSTLYLNKIGFWEKLVSQRFIFFSKLREWLSLLWLALKEKEVLKFKDRGRILNHFLLAGYLYTLLKDKGINHIHAHFLNAPTSVSLFLSRYLNIPFSFTMHASNIFIDYHMLKTKLQMCKRAVTISEYNKKYLVEKYGEEFAYKIHVIHCGISLHDFHPGIIEKENPPLILGVGQLVERKGFRYLVEACNLLKGKGLNFQCHIIGDGEQKELLKDMIYQYRLGNEITLLGKQVQESVRENLQKASIFALPSVITETGGREGIPVALMEAMAMQLPVVSTNTAGIPELIEASKEGILVEQKNAKELADALEILLNNPTIRIDMGKRGREKIKQEFDITQIPKLFEKIF